MAKYALLLLLCLSGVRVHAEDNVLQLAARDYTLDDFKRQLDHTPPAVVNRPIGSEGRAPLFYSVSHGRPQEVALLLLAGADPNARDAAGRTPAFAAATQATDDGMMTLELLAVARTDLDARDHDGLTLLAAAAQSGNHRAVKLLVLLGANPAPGNVPADRTPLAFATARNDAKAIQALRNGGAPSPDENSPNDEPATTNRVATMQAQTLRAHSFALAAGADVNQRGEYGTSALLAAAGTHDATGVSLLLMHGADPNLADASGTTPLMESVRYHDPIGQRMILDLILAGANVNAITKDGTTPLSVAVKRGNEFGAQWLIWRGASLDVHTPEGTLLDLAAAHANSPSMTALLKRGGQ